MKATRNQILQANLLSARYNMPRTTTLAWIKAKRIDGFKGWMKIYGFEALGLSNAESHAKCYQDICDWILAA